MKNISLANDARTLTENMDKEIESHLTNKEFHLASICIRQMLTTYSNSSDKTIETFKQEVYYTSLLARTLKELATADTTKSYEYMREAITLLENLENRTSVEDRQLSAYYAYLANFYEQDQNLRSAIDNYIKSIDLINQIEDDAADSNLIATVNSFSKQVCYLIYKLGLEEYQNKNYSLVIKHLQTVLDMEILHESLLNSCHRHLAKSLFYVAKKLSITPDGDLTIVINHLEAAVKNFQSIKTLSDKDVKDRAVCIKYLGSIQKQLLKTKNHKTTNENNTTPAPDEHAPRRKSSF